MLWMAVTADEYELPLAVEKTSYALAEKMKVAPCTISIMESRYRRGILKNKIRRPTNYGQPYRVVKVEEI